MGGIANEHVEWAVVNRMKTMLDAPPQTNFNVTQAFALFTSIVLWTKNRMWVAGNAIQPKEWQLPADGLAHGARENLRGALIVDDPWKLSTRTPALIDVDAYWTEQAINSDFTEMTAESFFKWVRDALAHGDGRTISPLHKPSKDHSKNWLAGFEIDFEDKKGSEHRLHLTLYLADMLRLGSILADQFCAFLSGGPNYFRDDVATATILETGAQQAA
jgi:hypothetical protein